MEKTTGRRPASLDPPPLPWPAEPALGLWVDLHQGRTHGGWGEVPLSWSDLDAWSRMRGVKPTHCQLELIRTIDRAYLTTSAEKGND